MYLLNGFKSHVFPAWLIQCFYFTMFLRQINTEGKRDDPLIFRAVMIQHTMQQGLASCDFKNPLNFFFLKKKQLTALAFLRVLNHWKNVNWQLRRWSCIPFPLLMNWKSDQPTQWNAYLFNGLLSLCANMLEALKWHSQTAIKDNNFFRLLSFTDIFFIFESLTTRSMKSTKWISIFGNTSICVTWYCNKYTYTNSWC